MSTADSDPSSDLGGWLRQLTTRAVEDQLHALQRYGELLRRVASGELDERMVGAETLRFLREEGVRYARGVANLSVEYQHALLDLDRARTDEYFSLVLDEIDEPEPSPPRRVELPLRGRLTEEVAAAFTIENTTAQPSDVIVDASDVTGPDGEMFRVPVAITPDRFPLEAGAKQQVRFRLPLTPEVFAVDRRYRFTLGVHGPDDLEVLVHLTIDEAPAIVISTGEPDATHDADGGTDGAPPAGAGQEPAGPPEEPTAD